MPTTTSTKTSITPPSPLTITYSYKFNGQALLGNVIRGYPLALPQALLSSFTGNQLAIPAPANTPPFIAASAFSPQLAQIAGGAIQPMAFRASKAILTMSLVNSVNSAYSASPIIGETSLQLVPLSQNGQMALASNDAMTVNGGFSFLGTTALHPDFDQVAFDAWIADNQLSTDVNAYVEATLSIEVFTSLPNFQSIKTAGYVQNSAYLCVANKRNFNVLFDSPAPPIINVGPATGQTLTAPQPFPASLAMPWAFSQSATFSTAGDLVASLSGTTQTEILISGSTGGNQLPGHSTSSNVSLLPVSLNHLKSL